MRLEYLDRNDRKAFVFRCDKAERAVPKAAGFWFHGSSSNCRKRGSKWGCTACELGLEWVWWIADYPAGRLAAAKLLDYAVGNVLVWDELRELTGAIEASHAAESDIDIPSPDGLEYLPFQRAGVAYALQRGATLIGDDMGLGKTIQALGVINADPSIQRVLIICRASLRLNWKREAERWLTRPVEVYVHEKTKEPVPAAAEVVVVSYALCRKGAAVESLREREWDLLVVDEVQDLKNPKSQQTKSVFGYYDSKIKARIPGLATKAKRKLYLSGTPMLNRPIELHPLLASMNPAEWGNFMTFAKRYCDAKQVWIGDRCVWDFKGSSNAEELAQRLRATCMVRRSKADVLSELPPKRRQVIMLPADGCKAAVREEQRGVGAMGATLEDYDTAIAELTGSTVAFAELSKARHALALRKVPATIEHLHTVLEGTDKVIVFAHHIDVVDGILRGLREAGVEAVRITGSTPEADRQAAVDAFQDDPGIRAIVGTIGAMGVGLTLTAASVVVFVELDWVPANLTQAEDRAHRIGQLDSVLIQHLVVDGSLDARMAELVVAKQTVMDQVLDPERGAARDKVAEAIKEAEAELAKVEEARERGVAIGRDGREYPIYAADKREAALTAMRLLLARCDGVQTKDGAGFSLATRSIGASLAGREELSDAQTYWAIKIATIHRRQLPEDLREQLAIAG